MRSTPARARRKARTTFDNRRFRTIMAAEQITGRAFAEEAGLDPATVSGALTGLRSPGELARLKIGAALKRLGLPSCEVKEAVRREK